MDIDHVQDVRDEIEDTMADMNEVSDLLGQGIGDPVDDDELLNELAEIEEAQANEAFLSMPAAPTAGRAEVQAALG